MNGLTPELLKSHTPDAIERRLSAPLSHSYLRDFVYGGIDGAVTTFAVVSGVAGAELSSGIVIVLGFANLIGDGFSMAASNFLGSRAELQQLEGARVAEEQHIDAYPEGEREEIRQILAAKGFAGTDLDRAVDIITSDRKLWVETMLREELGLSLERPHPLKAAAMTFTAFILIGVLPLLAFLVDYFHPLSQPFLLSSLMTGVAFFSVGAVKSRFVTQHWSWAGLETLLVGSVAAGLAYAVGVMLKGVL
jgi:VIT1/CCC1 family predicted Fe2+/Mn2+ transporter